MKRRAMFLVVLFSVLVVLLSGSASAEEPITGRIVLHYAKMETIKTATFTFDLLKGKGTWSEYSVITDQDGSTLFSKASGTAGPVEDGIKVVIEAKIECVGGTGRYEGFKGTGTVKG